MPVKNATQAVLEGLGVYLKNQIRSLEQVIYDFPAPNIQLKYPSLSIISGDPEFAPEANPYILTAGDMDERSKKAKIHRVVGTYEFKLQLDFWCRDKFERYRIYDEFFKAFNPNVDPMGLNIQLTDYHDVWCRYDQTGYRYQDSEISSQRSEWRVIVLLQAQCRAVLEKTEFIMETLEQTFTTPNTIEEDE